MQPTLIFDLPTKAGKCKVDYLTHILGEQPTPTHSQALTDIPSLTVTHTYIYIFVCVYLYDLWLFGAAGPERTQADDEEDEEQYRDDSDDRDVAGVGQRRRVGSLSWNHVGQIQHVAQRPAYITAFYLDTNTERGKTVLH